MLSVALGCADGERLQHDSATVYASVDPDNARQLAGVPGMAVRVVGDSEANKSVGLLRRLAAEGSEPRADVVWLGEFSRTRELCSRGVLRAPDPRAGGVSASCWTPFAGRARVIVAQAALQSPPRSVGDMTDPVWRDRVAVANPHFGSTGAHLAALYALWGEARFARWVRALKGNGVAVLPGNAQVKDAVAGGRFAWGLTDSDDAHGAILDGAPVRMVIPDQTTELGVMIIPNSVSIVAGGPNAEGARKVAEYLLSPEMEARLARSRSANIPLRHEVPGPPGFPKLSELRVMDVSYDAVMEALPDMLRTWDREWQRAP